MNATIVSILLGVFLAGILLFVLGRRGRRLNSHPQCKWCGFDLQGVYPESVTCPECGAGLKRKGAVRMGVRNRMPLVMALGVVVALLPLAPLFTVLYAAFTGTNLAKYTPTGVLLWQTKVASPALNKQIAEELIDRLIKKQLDKTQAKAVGDRVLDIQGDRNAQWDDVWGDVIERLNLNGDLSKEQQARFRKQSAVLTLRARAVVRAGDTLPISVKLASNRIGANSQLLAVAMLDSAKIGDTSLKKPSAITSTVFRGGAMPASSVYFYLYGPKLNAGWTMSQPQEQVVTINVPRATEPGTFTLNATLRCIVSDAQSGWGNTRSKAGDPDASDFTITQQITVLAPDAEPVKLTTPTPEAEKELTELLKQTNLQANVSASQSFIPLLSPVSVSRSISGQLTVDKPKTPFAFDVFVRLRDKEYSIGQIASAPAAQRQGGYWGGYAGNGQLSYYLAAELPTLQRSDKAIDLIFRPSTKAALRTADLVEIYGKEIVFKDFPLTRNTDQSIQSTGTVTTTVVDDTAEPKTEPEPKDDKK
ncbi:MAG: hypothetical protein QM783_11590 [Phycisphaerales bacterium]